MDTEKSDLVDESLLTTIDAHGFVVPKECQAEVLSKLSKKTKWRYKDACQEMTSAIKDRLPGIGTDPMIIGRKAADTLMNHLCREKAAKIKKGRFVWTERKT